MTAAGSSSSQSAGSDPRPDLDPNLLAGAITAARRSLRRLDDDQIPPKLREIAGRSGRLPAPLARRLLNELDRSAWLRDEAAQELTEDDDSLAAVFLRRPEGWQEQMISARSAASTARDRSSSARLEADLKKTLGRITRLEQLLAAAKTREEKSASVLREQKVKATKERERASAALTSRIEQQHKTIAKLEAELIDLTNNNRALREQIEMLRKSRRGKEPKRQAPARSLAVPPTDPLDLARHLDALWQSARSPMPVGGSTSVGDPPATTDLRLPTGVRPDHAEAIDWLTSVPTAVRVAIDGWNAAHQLASPPTAAERDRIVEAARRLDLASRGPRRIQVVFDSSDLIDQRTTKHYEVLFVPSADEQLIAEARENPVGLVLITSDRRVRETAEAAGAVGLWSEALIDWLKLRGRRTFGS